MFYYDSIEAIQQSMGVAETDVLKHIYTKSMTLGLNWGCERGM